MIINSLLSVSRSHNKIGGRTSLAGDVRRDRSELAAIQRFNARNKKRMRVGRLLKAASSSGRRVL